MEAMSLAVMHVLTSLMIHWIYTRTPLPGGPAATYISRSSLTYPPSSLSWSSGCLCGCCRSEEESLIEAVSYKTLSSEAVLSRATPYGATVTLPAVDVNDMVRACVRGREQGRIM